MSKSNKQNDKVEIVIDEDTGEMARENDIVIERKYYSREVNLLDDFNLIVSTSPGFELQAENELWFNLMGAGDTDSKIVNSKITGLLLAHTNKSPYEIVEYFHKAEEQEKTNKSSLFNKPFHPDTGEKADIYAQFIKKIVPIDRVVKTDIELIKKAALELISERDFATNPDSTFRITVRKRHTKLKNMEIIGPIADSIPNKVDLKNYDWIVQIEVIKNLTGISILRPNDIYEPLTERSLNK